MLTNEIKRQIVNTIVDCPPALLGNIPGLLDKLKADFPEIAEREILDCFEAAIVIIEQRASGYENEAADLNSLAPLFDGFPEGTPLGTCARIKASQGDPLAIAFLASDAGREALL